MSVYALAQLHIHDPEPYGRYMARFMPILEKYHGKLLAADEAPRVLGEELEQGRGFGWLAHARHCDQVGMRKG